MLDAARSAFRRAALLAAVTALGCASATESPSPPPSADGGPLAEGLIAIQVFPAQQTLIFTPGAPVAGKFRAQGIYRNGLARDITAEASWSLDQAPLGVIVAGLFSGSSRGGQSAVRASLGGHSGTAQLLVKAVLTRVETGAPPNAASLFGAAASDASLAPTIVYPYDGVLLPPNLPAFELQWNAGASTEDLYQVTLTSPTTDVTIYTSAAKYPFEPDVWNLVAWSNPGTYVSMSVAGMASASPGMAGTSTAVSAGFADKSVQGAIYYWSTSPEGIYRYDFSSGAASAMPYLLDGSGTGGYCVACHTISHDGTKMAPIYYTSSDPYEGGLYDIRAGKPMFDYGARIHYTFSSFLPDGASMVTSWNGALTLRAADATGAALGTVPLPAGALGATEPDVDPSRGNAVVYAFTPGSSTCAYFHGDRDSVGDGLAMTSMTVSGSTVTFGTPTVLVPPDPTCAGNHYKPAFSPDGRWVVFDESSGNTDDNADSKLYAVPVAGGAPLMMANVDNAGPLNSWPRWSPFAGSFAGKPIYWFTFHSQRAYGNELAAGQRGQLWMAALSPDLGEAGKDPSFPPFWIPIQDMTVPNITAQWTTAIIH